VRYPPATGPTLKLSPDTNANKLQFLAYSASETRSLKMVRMQMLMPAAPTPCRARPSSRTGKAFVGAAVHSAEPTVMMPRAVWSVAWRPKTSASWAKMGRNAAEVRLKAVMIQFSWSSWSGGKGVSVWLSCLWGWSCFSFFGSFSYCWRNNGTEGTGDD
jgi:hypothetical protein